MKSTFTAAIILEEISFKNSSADYFSFRLESKHERVNLRGLQFYDDKIFKTIEQDFWVRSNDKINFLFNSPAEQDLDSSASTDNIARLFSGQKGLTGTTEQLLISHEGQPLAFFCWFKTPVAAAELKEFPKILPSELWEDTDIESCFPSESVKNNQTVIKTGDENNAGAWEILVPQDKNSESKIEKTTAKKASTSSLEAIIETGGQSESQSIPPVIITEIFPAPVGKEAFEWIELLNQGSETFDLQNWIIDDSAGGSKPRRLGSHLLQPGQFLQISLKEYKVVLNNNSDSVRLFLPDGTPVAEQEYDSAKKGHSYALITHDDEEIWQWTSSPTPGQPNPHLTTISGIITSPASFGEIYHFSLQSDEIKQETAATTSDSSNDSNEFNSGKEILVIFSENVIKGPLAKEIFKSGTSGLFSGELAEAPANRGNFSHLLKLHSYEPGGDAMASPPHWPVAPDGAAGLLLLATPALLGGGGYWLLKRKQLSASGNCPKIENVKQLQETNNGQPLF